MYFFLQFLNFQILLIFGLGALKKQKTQYYICIWNTTPTPTTMANEASRIQLDEINLIKFDHLQQKKETEWTLLGIFKTTFFVKHNMYYLFQKYFNYTENILLLEIREAVKNFKRIRNPLKDGNFSSNPLQIAMLIQNPKYIILVHTP